MKTTKILFMLLFSYSSLSFCFADDTRDYDMAQVDDDPFDDEWMVDDELESESTVEQEGKGQEPAENKSAEEPSVEKTTASDDTFVIDRIEAIVFGPEDTDIITLSDVQRPSIDGAPRTLNDIKREKRIYQDAKKYRIIPDEEAIDKYLASVQKQHGINLEQLKDVFLGAGYSYEEGREQFGVMYTVNSMLDFKIRSRLVVPEREVEAYFKEHPEFEEPAFQISHVFIPCSKAQDRDEMRVQVEQFATGAGDLKIEWEEPFWVKESEISADKQFITTLKPGAIAQPVETEKGFELIKLTARRGRRERSFEDRYREISDLLRKPKYDQLFADYEKELEAQSSVVDF